MKPLFTLLAKYSRGAIAVLSFLAVVTTAFLSAFGNALPPQVAAWVSGAGTFIGAVLAFLQQPNPLTAEEKAQVRAVFRPGKR